MFCPRLTLRSLTIRYLDDFTLTLGRQEYLPLLVGGMGVDISTPALVLAISQLGGIAHLSDAMLPTVVDRHFGTRFVQRKRERFARTGERDFDLTELRNATDQYIGAVMSAKSGPGAIFLNVMEKLTMGDARLTLQTRLAAAMDAGIDGLTLSAGLHLGSLDLIKDHPRFHDVKLGIIVSSVRALKIFLHRAARVNRMPDYIVIEGPLAGGHLGFPLNWQDFDLATIVAEVQRLLAQEGLCIPVIPAGGIFTGAEAVAFLEQGAMAVQVATRFAITRECGLPDAVKQAFLAARPEDVEVNMVSPTGYPMRMLKSSPAIGTLVRPMCESFGYGLDCRGECSYRTAFFQETEAGNVARQAEKICLCTMMHGYKVWTCGQNVSRLKETTLRLPDGSYQLPSAAEVFLDYLHHADRQPLFTAHSNDEIHSRR